MTWDLMFAKAVGMQEYMTTKIPSRVAIAVHT